MHQVRKGLPEEAKKIRQAVFVDEQGFNNEFDEIDNMAWHIIFYVDDQAIGTARIFITEENNTTWHLGRVAILKDYRRQGYGREVLNLAEAAAKERGAEKLVLHAQCRSKSFYLNCGYVIQSKDFFLEGCPHCEMMKSFVDVE